MNLIKIIVLLLILFFIYVVLFREYFLARRKFKCKRCGNCCKLKVYLYKEDIKRIKKAGYHDFLDKNTNYMKRVNGYCKFLTLNKGIPSCSINGIKPKICVSYPMYRGIFGKKVDSRCHVFHGKISNLCTD